MDRSARGRRAGVRRKRLSASVAILALLSACGGGGGGGTGGDGGGAGPPIVAPPAPPPPPPSGNACSLRARQDWAAAKLNEWYLFPESMAANVNPDSFTSVQDYIDALVAPARAQNKDRFFTYVTSLAADNAYFTSGASAGLGARLSIDTAARRLLISEAFEDAPALAAGIDRGTEILAIGIGAADLRTVHSIIAAEGSAGISAALGPNTAGTARLLRVRDTNGTIRDVTVAKAEITVAPVSSRYGARILDDNGKKVGYLNLRTFIDTADPQLRNAFAQFKAQGVSEMIVDFRYNAGGQLAIADLVSNLLLGQRTAADVMNFRVHRPSKSSLNKAIYFAPQPQSIASMKIAFIATGSAGSASEVVMNSVIPYLGGKTALIGANTYGKPVGQGVFDLAQCDDRMRMIAFVTQNSEKQGDYFNGIASKFQSTCSAPDDLARPLGDAQESMVKSALDFLAGRPCASPISGGGGGITAQAVGKAPARELLTPNAPDTVQRELPGFF
jgi:C-terminal processing protease CtpA/Prc